MALFGCTASLLVLVSAHTLAALDASVVDVRASSSSIRATVELQDLFTDRFRELLDRGGTLHLLIQTELWEDRLLWDRLLQPTVSSMFRIVRDRSTGAVVVHGTRGALNTWPRDVGRLPVQVHVAPLAKVDALRRYYVHVIATIGTLAEREIDEMGEAVFGPDEQADGLEAIGKYVVRKFLQVTSYLQSSSTETTSRTFKGGEISK